MLAALKESGPVPGDVNGVKGTESSKKKRRPDKGVSWLQCLCQPSTCLETASITTNRARCDDTDAVQIDMEKLAENLQKMNEDDLLTIVQLIHEKKSPETMTRNDVDRKYLKN